MSRPTTALLVAAFAVAMLAVGLAVSVVDDGGGEAPAAPGTACINDAPLVVADTGDVGLGGSDLTVVQPDGSRSIVPSPADVVLDADVLPDRSGLVAVVAEGDYESAGPESTTIWAMGLDGAAARPLTDAVTVPLPPPPNDGVPRPPGPNEARSSDTQPVISPDGTTVAFARSIVGVTSILTVPLAGGEPTVVVPEAPFPGVSSPEWSPTGERLAYVRNVDAAGDPVFAEVHTIAPDGSDDRVVATVPDATTLDWSPDGAQILVSAEAGPDVGSVSAVDVATGRARTVAEAAARARWSRGGTQAVMVVEGDGGYRLVERSVAGVDGADVSGGVDRDLGVSIPFLYRYLDIAVASCIP